MKIVVNRFVSSNSATISEIRVDGNFICYGLEDPFRVQKVANETRIPEGVYDVRVRTVGGFHAKYSSRFRNMHQGMLQIVGVPNYEYVLIHVGNTAKDTAGCLLVGTGYEVSPDRMFVGGSVNAYKKLYKLVIATALKGEVYVRYVDSDRVH